ncbi:MAG: transposase, partial [Dolichospermum sp.]
IWDNASFHKSEALQTLIEEAGCRLLFLPAYSPDLNPIEGWWAVLKRVVTNGILLGPGDPKSQSSRRRCTVAGKSAAKRIC